MESRKEHRDWEKKEQSEVRTEERQRRNYNKGRGEDKFENEDRTEEG